ncbi:MAG: toll/interleukin-1 receptor domain-containing protein [Hyphomonadaceae bacterium]
MADIFISYASEDRNRVRPLADALIARGFNVWWDRSLAAGHDYAAVIERELKNAKAVIVVWTQSSAASTFVRDEAGRARDEGRLIPVLLDRIEIPLGFGAFQAEDFTRWNGGANAPQMQILEEAIKAKLEGRDVDGGAVAAKRRRLMARIRVVSVLTVLALIVVIAWGVNDIFRPEPPPTDLRAELLRLLAEGQLTPEQAIQLAQILESGALGETQTAAMDSRKRRRRPAQHIDARLKCNSRRCRKRSSTPPPARRSARRSFRSRVTPTRKCVWPRRRCRRIPRATRRCRRCGAMRRATRTIRCANRSICCAVRLAKPMAIRWASARLKWRPI